MITLSTPKLLQKNILLFFSPGIRKINLSLNELKLISKNRNIKDYKEKSENDLITALSEPKTKTTFSENKIKEIKKDFSKLRYGFPKNLSVSEIKKTEKNLLDLKISLSSLKKHYDYDDTEYRGIGETENLFDINLFKRVALNKIENDY